MTEKPVSEAASRIAEIVKGDERKLASELRAMAAERGIEAQIAHDRMELILR